MANNIAVTSFFGINCFHKNSKLDVVCLKMQVNYSSYIDSGSDKKSPTEAEEDQAKPHVDVTSHGKIEHQPTNDEDINDSTQNFDDVVTGSETIYEGFISDDESAGNRERPDELRQDIVLGTRSIIFLRSMKRTRKLCLLLQVMKVVHSKLMIRLHWKTKIQSISHSNYFNVSIGS